MTALGPDGEYRVFESLLDRFPKGILSVVIDSYDYRRFIRVYANKLRDKILAREGKVVFRPDSGEPNSTTMDVLELLHGVFGSLKNSKGYLALNPKVGTLWGDGIDYQPIKLILLNLSSHGWSADNIAFGMGGALLQQVHRDTFKFAFKASSVVVNNSIKDISKHPATDMGKASKPGRLKLIRTPDGRYETVSIHSMGIDLLQIVWETGQLLVDPTFAQIRERAQIYSI